MTKEVERRLERLERDAGEGDPFAYIDKLSDEELEARIEALRAT